MILQLIYLVSFDTGYSKRIFKELEEMSQTIQVGVRFPEVVVELIDAFADATTTELRENQNLPGLEVNRAGAIRILVEQALRDRGYEVETAKSTKQKNSRNEHFYGVNHGETKEKDPDRATAKGG